LDNLGSGTEALTQGQARFKPAVVTVIAMTACKVGYENCIKDSE